MKALSFVRTRQIQDSGFAEGDSSTKLKSRSVFYGTKPTFSYDVVGTGRDVGTGRLFRSPETNGTPTTSGGDQSVSPLETGGGVSDLDFQELLPFDEGNFGFFSQ